MGTVSVVSLFARETGIKRPSHILFPALFFGVWAPVFINVLRHFVRYFPHAPIGSPAAGAANDQTPMLGGREESTPESLLRASSRLPSLESISASASSAVTRPGLAALAASKA